MEARELTRLDPINEGEIAAADSQKLTPKQERYIEAIVSGNDLTTAARLAGYSYPGQTGWGLSQQPHIQRAIRARVAAQLNTEGATIGLRTLIKIANDETAPKGARVQAANSLLDRAGFVSKVLDKQRDSDDKPMSEMSASDLENLIERLQQRIEDASAKRNAEDAEFIDHGPVTIENPK